MPKYKALPDSTPESVEQAWRTDGEMGACRASIVKYARILDMTESGRDIKPLVSGMFEAIDRLKALEAKDSGKTETALFKVLSKAVNE